MQEGHKILIATVLSLGCVAILFYEIAKRMETAVTPGKLAASAIGIFYVVMLFSAGGAAALPSIVYVLMPVGLIWFADELGSITGVYFRGATINKTSPGFLVLILGWILLLLPIAVVAYVGFVQSR